MSTFTDNFNRANSTGLGANWTALALNFDISSNTAVGDGGGTNNVRCTSATASSDHSTQATLSSGVPSATSAGVMVRMSTAATESTLNCYLWRYNGTATQILKCVSGSFTALGTAYTAGLSNGVVLQLTCSGSTITGYTDAVQRQQITDTAVTSGTYGGMRCSNNLVHFDDFTVADLATAASLIPDERRVRRNVLLRR